MRKFFRTILVFTALGSMAGLFFGLFYVLYHTIFIIHYWDCSMFASGLVLQILLGAGLGLLGGLVLSVPIAGFGIGFSEQSLFSIFLSMTVFVLVTTILFLAVLPETMDATTPAGMGLLLLTLVSSVFLFFGFKRMTQSDRFNIPVSIASSPLKAWKYSLLLAAGVFVLLYAGDGIVKLTTGTSNPTQKGSGIDHPDIVLIILDTVRYDHLSCYGYTAETTPFLDELASKGILFEKAISTSCHTPPPHATLLTGKFPSSHGVYNDNRYLSAENIRVPAILNEAGYYSTAVVSNIALDRTFGYYRGFYEYNEAFDSGGYWKKIGLWGGIVRLLPVRIPFLSPPRTPGGLGLHMAGKTTDMAIAAVRKAPEERPVFLFLNYIDAHFPYLPPKQDLEYFLDEQEKHLPPGAKSPRESKLARADRKKISDVLFSHMSQAAADTLPPLPEEDIAYMNAAYDGEIRYMDRELRRLFENLESMGRMKNTLIIITSDHGEHFGEHNLFLHANSLYEQLIRVPLIVAWPGRIPPGRLDKRVSLVSIPATILEAAAVPVPDFFEGESLLPGMIGSGSLPDSGIRNRIVSQRLGNQAIYKGAFKEIVSKNGDIELFDLSSDPGENFNLADSLPGQAELLSNDLHRWEEEFAANTGTGKNDESREVPEPIREKLKALGYIN